MLLFCLLHLFEGVHAQSLDSTALPYRIYKNGSLKKNIEIQIESKQPFYMGSNTYVLHVGERFYQKYKHSKKGQKSVLTFLIPEREYVLWEEKSEMVLVYGYFAQNVSASKEKRAYQGRIFHRGVHQKTNKK